MRSAVLEKNFDFPTVGRISVLFEFQNSFSTALLRFPSMLRPKGLFINFYYLDKITFLAISSGFPQFFNFPLFLDFEGGNLAYPIVRKHY